MKKNLVKYFFFKLFKWIKYGRSYRMKSCKGCAKHKERISKLENYLHAKNEALKAIDFGWANGQPWCRKCNVHKYCHVKPNLP